MHKWLSYANEYVRQSDWKDLALIKLCLCSAGVLIGMSLAKRVKKLAAFGAMAVFIATYEDCNWGPAPIEGTVPIDTRKGTL